jgi:RNA-directed DNA polymerase
MPGAKGFRSVWKLVREIIRDEKLARTPPDALFWESDDSLSVEDFEIALNQRRFDSYESIEKAKSGQSEKRPISVPPHRLRKVQHAILQFLPADLVHENAYAYVPRKSAIIAASKHVNMIWGVKVDIKSFFHNIRENDVCAMFRSIGCDDFAANFYAKLVTRMPKEDLGLGALYGNGVLPQGSPTSGMISNLVCLKLDSELTNLAIDTNMTYTRYSDDIMFSSQHPYSLLNALRLVKSIRETLHRFGLTINENKTRIYNPNSSRQYLGLLITENRLRLPRHYRKRLELIDFGYRRVGIAEMEKSYSSPRSKFRQHSAKTRIHSQHLMTRYVGMLTYARQVEPQIAARYARNLMHTILKAPGEWASLCGPETRASLASALKTISEE